ncbi:MAG: fibronectin type III domain-containing protein [Bdellovibrionales bacterium]|nr:fibronectin type III domain-containing protein [Bdellovibrionales bacterium]
MKGHFPSVITNGRNRLVFADRERRELLERKRSIDQIDDRSRYKYGISNRHFMAFVLLLYRDVVFGHLSILVGLRDHLMFKKSTWRIALGLALILSGCGKGQRKLHVPSLGNIDGHKLYTNHCASCHNPIATSTKKNKTAAQIAAAISSVAQMSSLEALTSDEVQAIATVLVGTAPPPPDPTALTATPNSAAAITLSWSSGGGSTVDYQISYQLGTTAPATCSAGTLISESLISGTSYQVTGLNTDTLYSFRVCAINDKTTPDVSSGVTVSATTLTNTAPPPNPTALTATPNSVSAITLSWTSGAGSTVDYRISYQLGATAPANCSAGTLISESAISGTSHQVTGLNTNTQYSFRVCAINDKTTPDASTGVTVSATTLQTPPPPNGVALYGSKCASCHNPLATSTKKNKTAAQITAAISSVAQMSSQPALTSLTPAEIQAIATALVDTAPPPPPNPIALAAVPNLMSAITLTWTSGGGSTVDYRISYQLGAAAPANCTAGTKISESAISGTSHQVTGLSANTQYSFRVCAINGKTTPDVSSGVTVSAKTLQAPPPPNGVALYGSKCASCHNPLATSTKKNKTDAQITAAISTVAQMSSQPALTALTPAEIQAIATALVDTAPPPPAGLPLRYVAPIGTRVYVVSTFTDLFLPEVAQRTAADTPILNLINTLLLDKTGALGGPCRKYETRCVGDLNENIAAPMLPTPSTLRKGYMTRACEEILAKDRSVQNALSRAGITITSTADTTNLRRLFDHFYPGHNPNTKILSSLVSVVIDSRTKGLGDLNAWRYAMVPLCVGSALELL